jgi:hypothetical protein
MTSRRTSRNPSSDTNQRNSCRIFFVRFSSFTSLPTEVARKPATATMKEISDNETYTLPRWCMLGQLCGYYPWLSRVAVYRLIKKSLPKVWYGELSM